MRVEYSSNNSGGRWWLTDQNWYDLEKAGWTVNWYKDEKDSLTGGRERWLGALAFVASKSNTNLKEAINDWEKVTGANSSDLGCICCGTPHNFYEYDDEGKCRGSYSPEYPTQGARY